MPVSLLNVRVKWLWSAKPMSQLISASDNSGSNSRSQADRIRNR
jgi:hypothetical protein